MAYNSSNVPSTGPSEGEARSAFDRGFRGQPVPQPEPRSIEQLGRDVNGPDARQRSINEVARDVNGKP